MRIGDRKCCGRALVLSHAVPAQCDSDVPIDRAYSLGAMIGAPMGAYLVVAMIAAAPFVICGCGIEPLEGNELVGEYNVVLPDG